MQKLFQTKKISDCMHSFAANVHGCFIEIMTESNVLFAD